MAVIKLVEVMPLYMALIVVMVSWAYGYIPKHLGVYIKYTQLCIGQLYLNKVSLKNFFAITK